jgi:hypothetical protein
LVTPKTFAIAVIGVLAFAHLTQSFFPLPFAMVRAVDSAALAVLHTMHPPAPESCATAVSEEC